MTLRWGILGVARINRALLPPLRHSERNTLLGIASRDRGRAEAAARDASIPRAYGSYEQLLADPEIDVVYNPLPNALHVDWTIAAVRAGKHVLCEKPLALAPEDVDRVRAAAETAGRVVSEAFMYRHHRQTLTVKALVDDGALGKVGVVKGAFTFTLDRENDPRFDPALGGGSLWDVGCYPVSYARMLASAEPEEAFGWQMTGPTGVDLSFVGQLRFPGGLCAQFDCGFCAPYRAKIEIVGSEGSLQVPVPFRPAEREVVNLTRGNETQAIDITGDPLYVGEVEDMADAVLLGQPSRVSLADSRGNCAALVALLRSAREGRPCRVQAGAA